MKEFSQKSISILENTDSKNWAKVFVELKTEFWRKYAKGLIFSTTHGIDFFENVLNCLDGAKWKEEGEYGDNFRKLIKMEG